MAADITDQLYSLKPLFRGHFGVRSYSHQLLQFFGLLCHLNLSLLPVDEILTGISRILLCVLVYFNTA